MNKEKARQGNVSDHGSPLLQQHQKRPVGNDTHFKVNVNEFPSLSEVLKKNKEQENNSLKSVRSFSYSDKLKAQPQECTAHNAQFKNSCLRELKFGSSSTQKHPSFSPKESVNKNYTGNKEATTDPRTTKSQDRSRSISQRSKGEQSSSRNFASNSNVTNARKVKTETSVRKSYLVEKQESSSNVCINKNDSFTQQSVKSVSTAHEKPSTSSEKSQQLKSKNYNGGPIIPQPVVARSPSCSPVKTEIAFNKVSYRRNFSKPRIPETNRSVNSGTSSNQSLKFSQQNTVHQGANENICNRTGSQKPISVDKANNAVPKSPKITTKSQNNKVGVQNSNMQQVVAGSSEEKKKKKRKSKLKRQAALQTGKILVLTPEVHSKIINQSNNVSMQNHRNIFTNINDCEEYPELGSAEPKSVKETNVKASSVNLKKEIPAISVKSGIEIDKGETCSVVPQEDSEINENQTAAVSPDESSAVKVEGLEDNKSGVHSSNPITVSLFDMLCTAKSKKKEPEKKEIPEDIFPSKVVKKDIGKKVVCQTVNPLDSSRPTIKRGKEREKPKAKRPSRMRKLILMGRQERKENMAKKISDLLPLSENEKNIDEQIDQAIDDFLIDVRQLFQNPVIAGFGRNQNDLNCLLEFEMDNFVADIKNLKSHNNLNSSNNKTYSEHNSMDDIDCVFQNEEDTLQDSIETPCAAIRDLPKKLSEIKLHNISCTTENKADIVKEVIENTNVPCSSDDQTFHVEQSFEKNDVVLATAIRDFNSVIGSRSEESSNVVTMGGTVSSSENIVTDVTKSLISNEERLEATKLLLHSRKFRLYCNHFISKEIDESVFSLIDDLARFQDRMHQKDPVKAKIRRRLVYGIKEIKRHMKLKKLKCIIIATDIEDIRTEGGLNDTLDELKSLAEAYHIPYVFSHRRYNLGKVCRKSVPVSCVGIFNYEGSEKNFKKMVELRDDSKYDYSLLTKALAPKLTDGQVVELFKAEKESLDILREVSQGILKQFCLAPKEYKIDGTLEPSVICENSSANTNQKNFKTVLTPSVHVETKSNAYEHSKESDKLHNQIFDCLLENEQMDINTILTKYKIVKE